MFSKDSCRSRVTITIAQPIESVGFWSRGAIPGQAVPWLFVLQLAIPFSPSSKSHNALEPVGFQGRLKVCQNREAYTLPSQLNRPCPNKPRVAVQSSPFHFPRSGSSRPTLAKQLLRYVFHFSLSLLTSELVSSALTRLSYRVGLRQHTHRWFDCLVHPPLWVAPICR